MHYTRFRFEPAGNPEKYRVFQLEEETDGVAFLGYADRTVIDAMRRDCADLKIGSVVIAGKSDPTDKRFKVRTVQVGDDEYDLFIGEQFVLRRHNRDAGLTGIANAIQAGIDGRVLG